MSVVAMDMQLDFWSIQEPEPAEVPALAEIVRDGSVDGGRTLEDLVLGAWEELAVHRSTGCPVCGGAMVAAAPGGRLPLATCRSCGAELS